MPPDQLARHQAKKKYDSDNETKAKRQLHQLDQRLKHNITAVVDGTWDIKTAFQPKTVLSVDDSGEPTAGWKKLASDQESAMKLIGQTRTGSAKTKSDLATTFKKKFAKILLEIATATALKDAGLGSARSKGTTTSSAPERKRKQNQDTGRPEKPDDVNDSDDETGIAGRKKRAREDGKGSEVAAEKGRKSARELRQQKAEQAVATEYGYANYRDAENGGRDAEQAEIPAKSYKLQEGDRRVKLENSEALEREANVMTEPKREPEVKARLISKGARTGLHTDDDAPEQISTADIHEMSARLTTASTEARFQCKQGREVWERMSIEERQSWLGTYFHPFLKYGRCAIPELEDSYQTLEYLVSVLLRTEQITRPFSSPAEVDMKPQYAKALTYLLSNLEYQLYAGQSPSISQDLHYAEQAILFTHLEFPIRGRLITLILHHDRDYRFEWTSQAAVQELVSAVRRRLGGHEIIASPGDETSHSMQSEATWLSSEDRVIQYVQESRVDLAEGLPKEGE